MGNTILCVDDEQHGLMIRQMLLERVGYSVLTAGTAREGLALFSQNRWMRWCWTIICRTLMGGG